MNTTIDQSPPGSLTFRDAVVGDIPAIMALLVDDMLGQSRDVVTDPPDPAYVTALAAIGDNPHDHLIVVERDGAVVGCAQLTMLHGLSRKGMTRGLIEGVRVASSVRSGGVGAALVAHLVEMAREAGCGMVQLTTDKRRERAHAFYERLGFEATHVGMKRMLD
ncbi:GNAT family N-acetyltransferase [Acuticoccus mangrovi]|uniref:GNAT family N-acetyltransferase n=1 Tax=Acuticoccus mangrovi TaxID=2796142 RepID=A0A934ILV0_9HYPH|nr:GNAT family N-acetyltransferase [Acuticoccus mangrovi]MBJ3778878.1 GNAT family N-acetyltransferase [Acuticoccus mangrovi]